MALYKTITVTPSITVYIWKVSETEKELATGIVLTPICQQRMLGMKSEQHRKGFLSIRHLMAEAGYVDHDLYYDVNGKPHLKDGKHISITHSHDFTGIIVADNDEVGIDIELQREKILKIAHKFTQPQEYRTLANADAVIRKLTIVWGAKEALYKIYSEKGLSFLQHIDVKEFDLQDSESIAEIMYQGKNSSYSVDYLEFEGYTCVYSVKL
ncbi:4'-phosphopantetheinyl transferase superfamily protein [Cellulophaga baltica]|uniref:4'-phosphopantetheinyl transferase family protein n=1 Tax=Cellulophaga TaxID=104264 RepID=UPI001C0796FD|nr:MULTISPECIES: 4'-phosphopantetheinyl transferase family protein [Cellulophaga]MBU2995603.1 4'-phosphopantetheinyl transferase superfamily protein [Cellulophaga baltica]MDO6766997.1 4'-phosphopantetheinyl transferase superfamily protein [Cellulophaga sp. 1_MG-2023]